LRTPRYSRDNLLPRASSEFRALVTKGSRTAEKALYSSRALQEAVLQDRHEGAGAQQRDGALQRSTESSAAGIAALHRVTLAVRSSARCEADYTIWGRTHLALEGHTHTIAGQTVDPVNARPPGTIRHLGLPLLHVGSTGLPLLGGAALGQAKRSEEIDGTAANQWQPAQVAIKPGGTVTFRIAGGQTHPVGSGQAPPGDKRPDASKCQPRT
jgi:hypothetical protein